MCSFKHRDTGIVGDEWGEHAVEGGCVRPLVGVIAEEDAGRTTGVCDHKADREESVQEGLTEEDHLVHAGRSIDGGKCFSGRLEEEDDLGYEWHACDEAGSHGGKERETCGGRAKIVGSTVAGWARWSERSAEVARCN